MTEIHTVHQTRKRDLLRMEEARLTAALLSVRRKLNDLVPIGILPPEILEEIFQICVSWLYRCQKPKYRLAWTQVCSSWRRISLDSSRLWQRIDLCDSRFADEFLVRSKQAPLSIVSTSPLKLTADNLTRHASRLQCIDVFLFPDDMVNLFSTIGCNLATLTSLSLKVPPISPTVHLDLSFPLVRRLILDCVSIKWEGCSSLTHLSLRGLAPESCPSILQLQDIFERSPNLEYFRLESFTPSYLEMNTSRPPIPLLDLKEMVISGQQSTVSVLLSVISLGPRARLRLYLSLSGDLHTLLPRGLPYVATNRQNQVKTVRLSRNGTHFLLPSAHTWSEDPLQTTFSISSALISTATRVCSSLCHILDLSLVTKLELNTGVLHDIPLKVLQNFFADLVNLETLCTAFNDLGDLLGVLQATNPSTSACLYVPRLFRMSFSKPTELWWHFTNRWMELVVDFVKWRLIHSTPLYAIEFLRCHGVTAASTNELKAVVPLVIISEQVGTKSRF